MRLSHFESTTNPTILQRGQTYFDQGNVLEVNEGKNGHWYARVAGTDDYRVEISLNDDDVSYYDCDCPCEDLCKHVVATLCAIELLAEIRRNNPPRALETQVFDFAWSVISKGLFRDWSDLED